MIVNMWVCYEGLCLTLGFILYIQIPNGPVDLSQPLLWAKKMKKPVDVFIILTDSQVKQGRVNAVKTLQQYRSALSLPNTK